MRVTPTDLPGVLRLEPTVHRDARGHFVETWRRPAYAEAGLPSEFVQDNLSSSVRGVLRGLHFQHPRAQGKLVTVLAGEVFDVAVDVRAGSPTFGRWTGVTLSGETLHQLWIPPGFAHGFCCTSATALFAYKCTDLYDAASEGGIRWDDPDLGIRWPVAAPALSPKDAAFPRLRDIPRDRLPAYRSEPPAPPRR